MSYVIGDYVNIHVEGMDPMRGVVVGDPIKPGHTLVAGDPPNYPGDHEEYDPTSDTRRWLPVTDLSLDRIPVKLLGPDWDYDNPNYGYEGTTYYFDVADLTATATAKEPTP